MILESNEQQLYTAPALDHCARGETFLSTHWDISRTALKVGNAYNKSIDSDPIKLFAPVAVSETLGKLIASWYEQAKSVKREPTEKLETQETLHTREAYIALAKETQAQYQLIAKSIQVEMWKGFGVPYETSSQLSADIQQNEHLYFDLLSLSHPLLTPSEVIEFRVVHDFFGHGMFNCDFGPIGEENSLRVHQQMYSQLAFEAVVTEVRAKNACVNFSSENISKPFEERKRPEAKALLLPKEYRYDL